RGDARARPRHRRSHPRRLRHHRGRRDPRARPQRARCRRGAARPARTQLMPSILEHAPALQVVLPLAAAPLIVLVRSAAFAWAAASAVSYASLAIAVLLALRVAEGGAISYAIGSWQPPIGIEYRVDALSAFMLVAVSLTAALVAPHARRIVSAEVAADRVYLLYAMYCLCLAGLLGIAITGDAFNLFVFLEISSLAMYVLIALGPRRRALLAAFQYMLLGTVGATFYVIGVGFL